ncbi:MAG TPA: phospholipid carrier-dependent glycosyltransferase [Candidatus Sulfotelmatobacter sp.]|nr:phospholipid carrier-dependent glycosyltransferase [Candidatus Sulfotelmatobacter sp.]
MSAVQVAPGATTADLDSNIRSSAAGIRKASPNLLRFILLILALNTISALLFIALVNRPVYDDSYNIFDVHQYATQGLTRATLLAHRNPPGPGSFLWMAAAVRLLGGEELRDARIGAFLSWVLLAVGVLVGARYSKFPELWHGALLTSLVFPHAVEASATVLTEGPGLLFALLGALAWTEFASRARLTAGTMILGLLGGLSLGLAAICRQYNLALLAAAALLGLFEFRRTNSGKDRGPKWRLCFVLSLAMAAIPVVLLMSVWHGLSSPGMATGTSYHMIWKADVGLNLSRPVITAFYCGLYLVPLTFRGMFQLKGRARWVGLSVAFVGGIAAAHFGSAFLQPGPVRSAAWAASRVPGGEGVFLGLMGAVTIYNAIALGRLLWAERNVVISTPPFLFALLTSLFFIGEQMGVGGNIPLYDRYVLQIAPFLGLIAFSLLPRPDRGRVFALGALSVISQVMLWRYAFLV